MQTCKAEVGRGKLSGRSEDLEQIEIEINDKGEDEAAVRRGWGNIVDNSDPFRKPRKDYYDKQLLQWMYCKSGANITEENTAADITRRVGPERN